MDPKSEFCLLGISPQLLLLCNYEFKILDTKKTVRLAVIYDSTFFEESHSKTAVSNLISPMNQLVVDILSL